MMLGFRLKISPYPHPDPFYTFSGMYIITVPITAELIKVIASFISTLVWPVTIFTLLMVFKPHIIALLKRADTWKWGNLEGKFKENQELNEKLQKVETIAKPIKEDLERKEKEIIESISLKPKEMAKLMEGYKESFEAERALEEEKQALKNQIWINTSAFDRFHSGYMGQISSGKKRMLRDIINRLGVDNVIQWPFQKLNENFQPLIKKLQEDKGQHHAIYRTVMHGSEFCDWDGRLTEIGAGLLKTTAKEMFDEEADQPPHAPDRS